MRCRFVHFGDVHLGTQQYDCPERLIDFGRAWMHACRYVAETRPDFAICAGDLFNRFSINPITFDQAYAGLSLIREAGVPIVDIEGNHDRARYGEARSWIDSLADQGLLTHLDLEISAEGVRLVPVRPGRFSGSMVEWSGCRIIGARFLGASTERVLRELQRSLAELPKDGAFTILVLHAGITGVVPRVNAELTTQAIEPLREWVDYLALGHLHKHYAQGNFAYNGGSLETWALNEWGWERGILEVQIDTSQPQPVSYRLIDVPRRPFVILRIDTGSFDHPRALLRHCWERLELARDSLDDERPVVFVVLEGRLRFDQRDLRIDDLERACREVMDPLVAIVREEYDLRDFPTEGDFGGDTPVDRTTLEKAVIQARLAQDERYAPRAAQLAALAIELKERALQGASGTDLLQTFRTTLDRLDVPLPALTGVDDLSEGNR